MANTTNVNFSVVFDSSSGFWTFTFVGLQPIIVNNEGLSFEVVSYLTSTLDKYVMFTDETTNGSQGFMVDYSKCTSPVGATVWIWLDNLCALYA